jgi:hypothetical protein
MKSLFNDIRLRNNTGRVCALSQLIADGNARAVNTVMQHRVSSSIGGIIGLIFIGTLVLFFIAEIVLAQDVFFVHPVVVLAITSIAITSWYWSQDRRAT